MTEETARKLTAAVEELTNEMRMARTGDGRHPSEDWCTGATLDGTRCTAQAVADGLCRQHWRQAQAADHENPHDQKVVVAMYVSPRQMGLTDIAARARLPKRSAHLAVARLINDGWAVEVPHPRSKAWSQYKLTSDGRKWGYDLTAPAPRPSRRITTNQNKGGG